MKLEVLFFSILRSIVGGDSITVEIVQGGSVGDLLGQLYEQFPEMKAWDGKVRVAVDCCYVERDHVLSEGAEVAVMPPVQGG